MRYSIEGETGFGDGGIEFVGDNAAAVSVVKEACSKSMVMNALVIYPVPYADQEACFVREARAISPVRVDLPA